MKPIVVSAMYKFVSLPEYKSIAEPLLKVMKAHRVKGTIILAKEGVNGTVAGTEASIKFLHTWLASQSNLSGIRRKESYVEKTPFKRSKVKLKKEIVTMGVEGIDPTEVVGTYVKPKEWNQLITDDEVTLIDTRNTYEIEVGAFKNSLNPKTTTFREFPEYVRKHLDPKKHKKVAMCCTGGIRCEKSTAYLKSLGFDEVYHLEGGILKYLEEVPKEESLWEGECFVFDDRVTVDHHLQKGQYDQCHACRNPITKDDKRSAKYKSGISCPHCHNVNSDQQKIRFAERERQNQLAKQRGETHIGGEVQETIAQRRLHKKAQRKNQL